jgi:hypothetical protein
MPGRLTHLRGRESALSDLSLPFWVLTGADADHPASAFTTTEKLTAFLDKGGAGRWKISLVADRESLILAIADAHLQGATAVWLDPIAGAAQEDSIRLVDLMELSAGLGAA